MIKNSGARPDMFDEARMLCICILILMWAGAAMAALPFMALIRLRIRLDRRGAHNGYSSGRVRRRDDFRGRRR